MNYKYAGQIGRIKIYIAHTDRAYLFRATLPKFEYEESKPDVSELQQMAGYSPLGYGGPWNIMVGANPHNPQEVLIEWSCSSTCD